MGAMTPPSRKSCYNFRVISIDKVLDGDTIDVTIDLGFDLYKKRELELLVWTRQRRELETLRKRSIRYSCDELDEREVGWCH